MGRRLAVAAIAMGVATTAVGCGGPSATDAERLQRKIVARDAADDARDRSAFHRPALQSVRCEPEGAPRTFICHLDFAGIAPQRSRVVLSEDGERGATGPVTE